MDNAVENLIRKMARIPGLGPRSARRAALFLLQNRERLMVPLAREMNDVATRIRACADCGNLDTGDVCKICSDTRRDRSTICVVEDVGSLWAIERAAVFRGLYHVLGGTLSAIDGRGPEELHIDRLVKRAGHSDMAEIILALSATVDGQTTAHYIQERLADYRLRSPGWHMVYPLAGNLTILTTVRWRRH
jgi:recombination protein RecR